MFGNLALRWQKIKRFNVNSGRDFRRNAEQTEGGIKCVNGSAPETTTRVYGQI